jgi:hypothetical protein
MAFDLNHIKSCAKKDFNENIKAFDVAVGNFNEIVEKLLVGNVTEWNQNNSEGFLMYLPNPSGHKLEIHCGTLQSCLESMKSKPFLKNLYKPIVIHYSPFI